MKDDRQKSKCFIKCFAEKLELFNNSTGEPHRDKLIEYVEYLKPSDMQVSLKNLKVILNYFLDLQYGDFIDTCLAENKPDGDMCDYVYRCYKCFWEKLKSQPEPESVRLSFYDVLGFNEAFDEGEIIDEEVSKAVDEAAELKSADETQDETSAE